MKEEWERSSGWGVKVCIGSSSDCMTNRGEEEEELEDLEEIDVTNRAEDDELLIEALGRRHVIFLSYVIVTLVLPQGVLERIMLLERFVGVFRQCKQSLDNKKMQLNSRNNKSKLKIN